MKIQINTDKNISGNEELNATLTILISVELKRFHDQITRLEVHLSDEDGKKEGFNSIRCMLEARLENFKPIAVTEHSDTAKNAVHGALKKMKTSIDTLLSLKRSY
jgi:ribosome-associated translation inhibitor RaiA